MIHKLLPFVFLLLMPGCATKANLHESHHVALKNNTIPFAKITDVNNYAQVRNALAKVNLLVNSQISYENDLVQYGVDDYWASPNEVIRNGRGDCEDYAFLKRDILIRMGLPKERFKLLHADIKETSTFSHKRIEQHIVLAYYRNEHSNNPMILDNMRSDVMYLHARNDFQLNYVFDESAVWKAKGRKSVEKIFHTDILPKFTQALNRPVAD